MTAPLLRSIEPLEPRIAPATVLDFQVNSTGTRATWTDVDGDKVSLTSNKGVLKPHNFTFLEQQDGDLGYQLSLLDLSDEFTSGFTLTFSARRDTVNKVGDGAVNVGWINALYSDITTITIPGDLARLDVGDPNFNTPALGMLTVHSAGMLGAYTQGSNPGGVDPTVDWEIYGKLGGLNVKGDFSVNL